MTKSALVEVRKSKVCSGYEILVRGCVVEGGFFSREAAVDAAGEWLKQAQAEDVAPLEPGITRDYANFNRISNPDGV